MTTGSKQRPFVLRARSETRSCVTSPAILKVQIASEGASAVVTSRARVVAGRKMFPRTRRTHLPSLRQAGGVVVAIGAVQPLARAVLRVTKADAVRNRSS